jgi:hypothetical protein
MENYNYNVICDYWNRHPMINWKFNCNCESRYWVDPIDIKLYLKHLWKRYTKDLTETEKMECKNFITNK